MSGAGKSIGGGLFDEPPQSRVREVPAPTPRFTVSELTAGITARLSGFGRITVEGEVSGLKRASSGHVYFELKDAAARISCAVWASQVRRSGAAALADGDQVAATGKLDVFAPRGTYSLHVDRVEPVGIGVLLARLAALKAELAARGWFDRRRPLPAWPRLVGVVTSRDGAALRDFLRTRSHRWPAYPLRLAHAPVQGPGAAAALAGAIARIAASGVDIVVLIRGGGSLEDLMAFQEEPVLRAIWECPVPVVCGVGHETDTTLADLVADVRAHTPTDAAVRVIPDLRALLDRLERGRGYLVEALLAHVERRTERLARLARARVLAGAGWILAERARQLAHLERRAIACGTASVERRAARLAEVEARLRKKSPRVRVAAWEQRVHAAGVRLAGVGARLLDTRERTLAARAGALHALSPLAVLARGYSLTRGPDGAPLVDARAVAPGDEIETTLAAGRLRSRVEDVLPAESREAGRTP